ncbi:MAG: VOC family protein [Pseudomonadota bacterium]
MASAPQVTGIGGLFFRAQDPAALSAWYAEHLGVGGDPDGTPWRQDAGHTVFAPFKADTEYFPADRAFMLNFRVDDLDALIARLDAAGIVVRTEPEWDTQGVGRFARIHDPEGNPIELWEPAL